MSRVLVVEDDAALRVLCRSILRMRGYMVAEAASAPLAMQLLARYADIAMIITDLHLIGLDGLTLIDAVRNQGMDIPVIVMSGDIDDEEEVMARGARLFLAKPFTYSQFVDAMSRVPRRQELPVRYR